jgi:hypothetical protein
MSHVQYANSVVGHAEIFYKYDQTYGPIYRSWAGSRGMVTVSSPEAAEVRNLFVEVSTSLCQDTSGRKALIQAAN